MRPLWIRDGKILPATALRITRQAVWKRFCRQPEVDSAVPPV